MSKEKTMLHPADTIILILMVVFLIVGSVFISYEIYEAAFGFYGLAIGMSIGAGLKTWGEELDEHVQENESPLNNLK